MNKLIICMAGCLLLTAHPIQAQDSTRQAKDTSILQPVPSKDTSILQPVDTAAPKIQDTSAAAVSQPAHDGSVKTPDSPVAQDTAQQQPPPASAKRELDTHWFISPLLK